VSRRRRCPPAPAGRDLPFEIEDGVHDDAVRYLERFGFLVRLEGATPIDEAAVDELRRRIENRAQQRRRRRSA